MSPDAPKGRAVLLVDGANGYRRFRDVGIEANKLDLRKVARALAGPARTVVGIRYYTGKVERSGNQLLFAHQQSLLSLLGKQGVQIRLGRVESRTEANELAEQMLQFLAVPRPADLRLPEDAYRALYAMANTHRRVTYWVQKAVDTLLVADLARMAADNEFDAAYVLSLDGDMTPGIEFARSRGKKVFGTGPAGLNYQIRRACDAFIVLDEARLANCYLD